MKEQALIILVILTLGLAAYGLVEWAQPVKAAPSNPDVCELVGTTGAIVIYFCEPSNGPSFLVNNVGFMQVVE